MLPGLWLPIRRNIQFFHALRGVVRRDRNFKQVGAAHTLMHCEFARNRCAFARTQYRLTDDNLGRSASFQQCSHTRHT